MRRKKREGLAKKVMMELVKVVGITKGDPRPSPSGLASLVRK